MFLAILVTILLTIVFRRSVVIAAMLGILVLAAMSPNAGSGVIAHGVFALQSLFRAMLLAGSDLFDIMLLVAIMLAMLKSMAAEGADELMIAPMRKLIVGPWSAFFVLAITAYVCSIFFWPSPATALVGTVLIPVALRAGLPALGAAAAINIAAHGIALSSDPVIQAATRISARSAGIDAAPILYYTVIFSTVTGVVAMILTVIFLRRDMRLKPQALAGGGMAAAGGSISGEPGEGGEEIAAELPPHGRFGLPLAILTPLLLFGVGVLIIYRAIALPEKAIYGGEATALLGGAAICVLIMACIAHDGHRAMESVIHHITEGFTFAIKVFGPVLPIVAFFLLGDPAHAERVLGPGTPGYMLDFGQSVGRYLGPDNPLLPVGVMIVGILSGIDGFGFSGLPLTGSVAAALTGATSTDSTALLASLGQIGSIWVGGGTLAPWSGVCIVAALANVRPDELARRNFVPVIAGLIASALVGIALLVAF
ncbi:hypothetical protein [Erythrobacter sp. SG61-1L]|uniref:hypothetical protein n=1 Tax=Erythrobacter sp. SG61-1L TaxID=1603897 RepID=UPI0006C92AAE|nr:hypothetical protein [Erythrobacter sp. SG61-1L]